MIGLPSIVMSMMPPHVRIIRHRSNVAGVPGDRDADLRCADIALRRLYARYPAPLDANPRDFAALEDIDAEGIGGAGVAPGDRVVPHRAAAGLQQPAENWKTR